jgi:hypothetical protein
MSSPADPIAASMLSLLRLTSNVIDVPVPVTVTAVNALVCVGNAPLRMPTSRTLRPVKSTPENVQRARSSNAIARPL